MTLAAHPVVKAATSLLALVAGGFDPNARALESYKYWRMVGYDHDSACAWLGNEDGETSFKPGVVGDKGEAYGPAQHHQARIDNIKTRTGIDIKTGSHLDQLKGINWESSQDHEYGHVRAHLLAAVGLEAKVRVLVHEFEHSAHQDSDVVKRKAFAQYWSHKFQELA